MKIFKYIALSVVMASASCTGVIDINPTHILDSSNAFQNINDFNSALNGAYSRFRSIQYYGRNLSVIPDMMTDNLSESPENLPQGTRGIVDWQYAADDVEIENAWLISYRIIDDANIIINGIHAFTTAANQRTANRIKGQALALRALVHFDLLRWFANDLDRNASTPGIPVKIQSANANPNARPARNTVKEVYDQIFADINEALTLLNNVDTPINTTSNRGKLDATGVNALAARVSLFAGQFQDAIRFSGEVINRIPLATRAQFPGLWRDTNVAEVVWGLVFNPGQGGPALEVYSPATDRASYDPSPELLNLYDRANDVRFNAYFTQGFRIRVTRDPNRFIATKYLGQGSNVDGVANFKVFRTAEMYLIRAEALARTGNEAGARSDLNALRSARIMNYAPGNESGAALLAAIATERRKELWLEGHRWFDLKRTNLTITRQDCRPPATSCNLSSNSFRWAWPIPQNELLANPILHKIAVTKSFR